MIPSIQEPMHMMHYQSGNIQYGYQYSPVSPLYTTTSTTAAAAAATTTTPGTSNASNSKEFMNFTAHFVAQLCRETCLEELNVIPFDMMEYVDQVLSTTQVSLSIVVLALSIIKKVQRKVNAAIVGGGLASFGESMEDQRNQVLTRMASKMNVKTVFIVSLMIAMKSPNGCCNTFTNKTWSQVALIPSQILNALELDVALFLGFDLWDKEPEYLAWLNVVRNAA
ncbi:hypothetical protein BDR26DRAFT_851667 [Obelidium mucronatum]|nr:hypothetical protein BDR26DRAFT_851667 [Obelidium mucronatum]